MPRHSNKRRISRRSRVRRSRRSRNVRRSTRQSRKKIRKGAMDGLDSEFSRRGLELRVIRDSHDHPEPPEHMVANPTDHVPLYPWHGPGDLNRVSSSLPRDTVPMLSPSPEDGPVQREKLRRRIRVPSPDNQGEKRPRRSSPDPSPAPDQAVQHRPETVPVPNLNRTQTEIPDSTPADDHRDKLQPEPDPVTEPTLYRTKTKIHT